MSSDVGARRLRLRGKHGQHGFGFAPPSEAQVVQAPRPALGLAEVQQAPVGDDGVVVAQERLQTRWTLMSREEKDARNEKRSGKRKGEKRGNRTKEGRKVETLNRPSSFVEVVMM